MSSNQPYTQINLSNYEEYFLLYLDGELTDAARLEVEQFVGLHPHLQAELDLLCGTKLDADDFLFGHKEQLLAKNMKVDVIDESLLLFIDDELTGDDQKQVEQKMAHDKDYRFQHQLLTRTKLDASEVVAYPYKKELYRQTKKRLVPLALYRIAAVLLLLWGVVLFWQYNESAPTMTPIAETNKELPPVEKDIQTQPTYQQSTLPVEEKNTLALQPTEKTKSITNNRFAVKDRAKEIVVQAPDPRDRVIVFHDAPNNTVVQNKKIELVAPSQQTINSNPVTTTTQPAYTTIETAATTESMVSNAVVISNDEKKGSVRGFLRKASRFIERRTGINPVNEDDELVIAAVALKLK